MKYIKLFEEYDAKVHNALDMTRKAMNTKTSKNIMHVLSLLDDLIHLDFKNIKNTFRNKEGYRKGSDMFTELSIAISALKKEEGRPELALFYDMKRYGINVDKIINLLNDNDVKRYLEKDRRGSRRLDSLKDTIDLLKRFKRWKDADYGEEEELDEGLFHYGAYGPPETTEERAERKRKFEEFLRKQKEEEETEDIEDEIVGDEEDKDPDLN